MVKTSTAVDISEKVENAGAFDSSAHQRNKNKTGKTYHVDDGFLH
jgi:hypothetical protein